MDDFDIQRLEKAIRKSQEEKCLSEFAKRMLEKLNSEVGRSYKLRLGKDINQLIRNAALETMIAKWEGHYTAKKSIYSYFVDLCKASYRSESWKYKT